MTDDNIDDKLNELREEESKGNRRDRDDPQSQPDFVDALDEALEEDDRMDDVFEELQDAYDGDSGLQKSSRSAIIRLAVRVGLQEGTESVLDDLEEAVSRRQTTTV